MRFFIFPYNPGSNSAKALKDVLDAKFIRHENSKFSGAPDKVIINWGFRGAFPFNVGESPVLNLPERVALVSNKKTFFEKAKEFNLPVPPFTTSKETVIEWLENGKTAFARTILNGHSGEGIVDIQKIEDLDNVEDGTFFTQYIKKKDEYRAHVFRKGLGSEDFYVALVQRKSIPIKLIQEIGPENINFRIRNHKNGFIFQRNNLDYVPEVVYDVAIDSVKEFGLDFGAVDIIYNRKKEAAFILEINSAPGLEGETIELYDYSFRKNFSLPNSPYTRNRVYIDDVVEELVRNIREEEQ